MYQNFGDAIIKTLITTGYTKKRINYLILFLLTLLIRTLINSFLIFIIYTDIWPVDFLIQVVLSILLVLKTNWIYFVVEKYKNESMKIADFLIDHYTPENFRVWKKKIIVCICVYFIIYFWFVSINSLIMIEYITQFLICYFVVDNIENKNGLLFDIYNKALDKRYVKVIKKDDLVIIDNYNSPPKERKVEEDGDFVIFKE